jgi:DNA polymerase V
VPFQPFDTGPRRLSQLEDSEKWHGGYESDLDLNDYLIRHPAATFFVKAEGRGMEYAGIFSGDLLVVDRSLEPSHGRIAVAVVEGELVLRILAIKDRRAFLVSESHTVHAIGIAPDTDTSLWGIVIGVVRKA